MAFGIVLCTGIKLAIIMARGDDEVDFASTIWSIGWVTIGDRLCTNRFSIAPMYTSTSVCSFEYSTQCDRKKVQNSKKPVTGANWNGYL